MPGADPRLPHCGAIDRRVGADFDIVLDDHAADLRNLVVGPVGLTGEAEPVAADHGAVLDDDPVADRHALAHGDAGVDDAVVPDHGLVTNGDVRMEDRARADSRAGADADERTDGRIRGHVRRLGDARQPMNAGRRRRPRREQLHGARERQVRVRRAKHRARRRLGALAENHRRRARRAQVRGVFGVDEEGQLARPRLLDAGETVDLDLAVTLEPAPELRGNLPEFHCASIRSYGVRARWKNDARCSSWSVRRDLTHALGARLWILRQERPQLPKGEARLRGPGHDRHRAPRAAQREVVPHDAEHEVVADEIGPRNENEET